MTHRLDRQQLIGWPVQHYRLCHETTPTSHTHTHVSVNNIQTAKRMNAGKSECKVQVYLGEKQVQFALQPGQATEGGYPRLYHVIQVTETVYEVGVLQHTHHLSLRQQCTTSSQHPTGQYSGEYQPLSSMKCEASTVPLST
jgi:hypothetical protein